MEAAFENPAGHRYPGQCKDCRAFDPENGGRCRAHPPMVVVIPAMSKISGQMKIDLYGEHPPVKPDGHCWEWRSAQPE